MIICKKEIEEKSKKKISKIRKYAIFGIVAISVVFSNIFIITVD